MSLAFIRDRVLDDYLESKTDTRRAWEAYSRAAAREQALLELMAEFVPGPRARLRSRAGMAWVRIERGASGAPVGADVDWSRKRGPYKKKRRSAE